MSTVHIWVNISNNPAFCQGDFIGANAQYVLSLFSIGIHSNEILIFDSAFYDGNVIAHNAGDFVFHTVIPALKAACPGKKIIITE